MKALVVTEALRGSLGAAPQGLPGRRPDRPRVRGADGGHRGVRGAHRAPQTQVTAAVLDAAENLKVVACAGIGLDNVDVEAATRKGVMVERAAVEHRLLAAEHAIALLLAQAQNIPRANAALKEGRWSAPRSRASSSRARRSGSLGSARREPAAQRGAGLGMRVIAFDPYVPKDRAKEMGVEPMPSLEALLVQADFVTIHLPRTPDTEGLIGDHELDGQARRAAREHGHGDHRGGGRVVKALEDGRGRRRARRVRPRADDGLAEARMDNVVVTPHQRLDRGGPGQGRHDRRRDGASGPERRVRPVRGERLRRRRGRRDRPPVPPLCDKLGRILTGMAEGAVRSIECQYLGRIADADTRVLTLAVVKGVLTGIVHEPVRRERAMIAGASAASRSARCAPRSRPTT